MKILINKIFFRNVINDLKKTHPFASERIGYLMGRVEDKSLVLDEWLSIKNEFYEKSDDVGARVGRDGMIFIMKKASQSNKSFFHTHLHEFQKIPTFSLVDKNSLLEVTRALISLTEECLHGGIVIGQYSSRVKYWTDKECINSKELIIKYGILTKT